MRLLSQREHSRLELESKLAAYEEVPGTLAQALDELEAKGYLSEHRVAESLVHRRASRLGAGRLRQELQAKGLDRDLIDDTLAGLQGSELERARAVWTRRYAAAPANAQERARQTRFLLARGFSGAIVRQVLGATSRGGDETAPDEPAHDETGHQLRGDPESSAP